MKALLISLVLIAGGVTGYIYWQQGKYPSAAQNEPKVELIKKGKIEEKITASGKVEAKGGLFPVLTETNGKIVKISPKVINNAKVTKGELLIQLDDSVEQFKVKLAVAAVGTAKANLTKADASIEAAEAKKNAVEKKLEAAKHLVQKLRTEKDNVGARNLRDAELEYEVNEAESKAVYSLIKEALGNKETAIASIAQAEAGKTLAERGLEQTKITAPTDGVIFKVSEHVREGQLVAPTLGALITIAPHPDEWEVKALISEQDIGRLQNKLRSGEPVNVSFTTEAYSIEKIKPFTGKVLSIDPLPVVQQRSGFGGLEALQALTSGSSSSGPASYAVKIAVDPIDPAISKNHPLLVGYTATDLQIVLANFDNIVCAPSAALSFTPEGLSDLQQSDLRKNEEEGYSALWFWNNGKYEPKYIKAGASEEGRTHVLEVKGGKPEDLLSKSAVIEGPKKQENKGLFGPVKFPG